MIGRTRASTHAHPFECDPLYSFFFFFFNVLCIGCLHSIKRIEQRRTYKLNDINMLRNRLLLRFMLYKPTHITHACFFFIRL